jgi:outer membrane murein-binding lipoprotein Lpp
MTNVDEMAKRVDSLQFIVVYNAQLLRRDLDSKVIWIYVMLGVMIVASMMMYGALNQAQRQRRDLEERVFNTLSTSVTELETKIKQVESEIVSHAPPKRAAAPKKKK